VLVRGRAAFPFLWKLNNARMWVAQKEITATLLEGKFNTD
jgi:hypothetical protein